MILDYVIKFHLQDCIYILSEKDNLAHYHVKIDFLKLFETYPHVGDKVLCCPIESLPICDEDLVKAQQNILEQDEYKTKILVLEYCHIKRNIHARFFGLPVCPELHRTIFPKNIDLACFLKVTGTVVRATQSKMLEYQRKYVCMKCKYENLAKADFEARYILKAPNKCGNVDPKCRCSTFTQLNLVSREYCKDYQEIKIQEQVNKLNIGTIPGSMWVVLEDDLVDCCKPGDDINICGTVRRRWRPTSQNKKSEVELVLQANYVEVCNAQRSQVISAAPDVKDCFNEFWNKFEACPLKGRDQILSSVCSQVYGLHLVKLALLLTIITGSNHVVEDETEKKSSSEDKHINRVRGQCHLLLVGDPGTGKSQLLRAGVELTPRSVFTSGAGSTRAGLTCSALREDGEWQLEAGALVLSDGGVCCIDEISQLRDHDRAAIHEAMEQQTISIAKAGIVCKLNTRCAVIAACNPKGHYQTDQPLSVNVSLGTPLLSRFDLIFILLDSKNKTWDKLVSSYILFGGTENPADRKKQWSLEKLQMYIGLVGPKHVEMTKSANIILQSYYMLQRKSEYRDPSRTTVRMLDSLFRLSQAHCRLLFRTTILPVDAITAVSLVDLSMQDCTLRDTVDALHSTFHKYPDFDYLCTAKKLLTKLNLYEIWQEELLYYGKLLQVDHKTLENEINNNSYKLFAKYDYVADDNIPLSSTLVTSSYFNNKKFNQENLDFENNKRHDHDSTFKERNEVSHKLAATLHKHARLNVKEPKSPTKNPIKRKRKEVTVDSSSIRDKSRKTVKKPKTKNRDETDHISDSDEEFKDTKKILNNIPSVNDVFNDLGINFNFKNTCNNKETVKNKTKADYKSITELNVQSKRSESSSNIDVNTKKSCLEANDQQDTINTKERDKISLERNCSEKIQRKSSMTVNKLKQFQFVEKHDLGKFYDENTVKSKSMKNTEHLHDKEEKNESNNKCLISSVTNTNPSVSNSQISLFESSDCEIDLDI